MDVPEERDIEIGTKKKNVSSPKTKTSKLCIDKGHLKINDMEELLHTCKYKSSNNIFVKKEDPKLSFGNFIKDQFCDNENEKENIQLKPCRKRILSFNNEFQLVPLLRKVSCEPDPTCGKSNINESDAHEVKLTKIKINNLSDRHKGNSNLRFIEDNNKSNFLCVEKEENHIVITIGDVQPAKNKPKCQSCKKIARIKLMNQNSP